MKNLFRKFTFNKISRLILIYDIKSKIKIPPEIPFIPRGKTNLDYTLILMIVNTLLNRLIMKYFHTFTAAGCLYNFY